MADRGRHPLDRLNSVARARAASARAALWRPRGNGATGRTGNAEHLPRDWSGSGYGEIVCHCEMVTRREIEAALSGPPPPGDFGGLKRRTRCAMGRCQGFYCSGRLAQLTEGKFATPLTTGIADAAA